MKSLRVADLEKAGCQSPGCTHDDHDMIYFHGKCHIEANCSLKISDDVVMFNCAECGQPIVDVVVAAFKVCGVCRPGCKTDSLEVSYKFGTGKLECRCFGCKSKRMEITVAK